MKLKGPPWPGGGLQGRDWGSGYIEEGSVGAHAHGMTDHDGRKAGRGREKGEGPDEASWQGELAAFMHWSAHITALPPRSLPVP